jgi:hypothetical protein
MCLLVKTMWKCRSIIVCCTQNCCVTVATYDIVHNGWARIHPTLVLQPTRPIVLTYDISQSKQSKVTNMIGVIQIKTTKLFQYFLSIKTAFTVWQTSVHYYWILLVSRKKDTFEHEVQFHVASECNILSCTANVPSMLPLQSFWIVIMKCFVKETNMDAWLHSKETRYSYAK